MTLMKVFTHLSASVLLFLTLFSATAAAQATADTIRVNFSNSATAAPAGYLKDYGLPYSRQAGYTYGWVTAGGHDPVDLSENGRNRNPFPDVNTVLETLMHMQFADVSPNQTNVPDGAWEMALPNGFYEVAVTAGDYGSEGLRGTTHVINAESRSVVYEPATYGKVNLFTRRAVVEVTDGRLTLDPIGGTNTKIISATVAPADALKQAYCSDPNPPDGTTGVSPFSFQITAAINVPAGYELDKATLTGNVRLFEQTAGGLVAVAGNANDTGGGDAVTLTAASALKPATTYVFKIEGLEANRIGNLKDRIPFKAFSSYFTTSAKEDTNPPATLDGVAFTQVSGSLLGPGTTDRFSSLEIGPDGKLYATTLSNKIKRWTIKADGTLTNLEELTVNLKAAPHPETGAVSSSPRLVIGLAFAPEATATNLIAYVTHSALTLTDGPEWDGVLTKLSGPNLENAQDVLIHLPRSKKDHLTNSVRFGPNNDLFIAQGSNTAGGEADIVWGMRLERLLSGALLRLNRNKLPSQLPLSVYTSNNLAVINAAPATGLKLSDGTYNPYSADSPLTLFATGIRNAYDMVFHSNGWAYIPTNGTAGNNSTSPITPPSNIYVSRDPSGKGVRRPNGTYFTDPGVPSIEGGETQKDWLFKSKGGSYHGHPNPFRGEFVMNHGGKAYSGLPGQLESSYRDVAKYPATLAPDPNYQEVAYDFGMNKSPNGAIEYRSDAFGGKLKGMLLVTRFSGQDDIIVLQPGNNSGDIISAFQDVPGLQSLDDPLDIIEDRRTGNLYVSQYDRGGDGHQKLLLMRVADPTKPAPVITATPAEAIMQATVGVTATQRDTSTIRIRNAGNSDLHINSFRVSGAFGSEFKVSGPTTLTLAPGGSRDYTVVYAPKLDNSGLGYQEAELTFDTDGNQGAPFVVGLFALKTANYGGSNEPPLQQVLNALGINVEVGWTTLNSDVKPVAKGEEIMAGLFSGNGAGPVKVTPVARYSPAEALPFGWYTRSTSGVTHKQLAVQQGGQGNAQTLYPAIQSGGTTSFTAPAGGFGIYLYSGVYSRRSYSEDELNGDVPHRMRLYPVRDRGNVPVDGAYLLCFEDATNGDYQDYVFLLENVKLYDPGTQTLRFAQNSLSFVAPVAGATAQQSATVTTSNGSTGNTVTLTASEPWITVPATVAAGQAAPITITSPGLAVGTYTGTVRASASGYGTATLTVNATVEKDMNFAVKVNFQDGTFTPPAGYVADTGKPYGPQGNLTYGWINPYSKSPADNTGAARGAARRVYESSTDQDKLMRSFNMLDWPGQSPAVPRDWEIAVPNGTYFVELAAGDPDYVNSRHTLRAEGTFLVTDFYPTLADYYRVGSGYVEVTDGKLTIDDNGAMGTGNSKLIYVNLRKVAPAPTTGARLRIENLVKLPGTNRAFPSDNWFAFSRVQSGDVLFHDRSKARIHNDGTAPLVITKLGTTSPADFTVSGLTIPSGGLTVRPGEYVDATINFVTNQGEGRRLVTDQLVIESNAENNRTTHVTLRGGYTLMPEGINELTAEQLFNTFGYISRMGRTSSGQVIDHPTSDYPSDAAVASGAEGDMVLTKFWVQQDKSKPVRIFTMATMHGYGGAPVALRDENRNGLTDLRYNHGDHYYQSILPKETDASTLLAGDEVATVDKPFQIMIAGYGTAGGSPDGSLRDKILGVRAFKAIDQDGRVIPNEYIFIQDYIHSGCGPGMANCDWQDNVVYATNIRPAQLPTAAAIADFTTESQTPTDYNVAGSFTAGYPGNRLFYRATLGSGSALPAWITLEEETGVFTFKAPDSAVGQTFPIKVTVTADNGVTLTATYQLRVTQGTATPSNEPPVAVAAVNPQTGTEPLTVTLDGTGSYDTDGSISRYQWSWGGGTATGASPQATFSAGVYTISLTVTDNGGAKTTASTTLIVNTPSRGDAVSVFNLEAECAEVGAKWTTATATDASEGQYVVSGGVNYMNVPPTDVPENRIRFTLQNAAAGYYHLFARIQAFDGGSDSYWVRINGTQWIQWSSGMIKGEGFSWNHLPGDLPYLQNGLNTIDFAFREAGTKLDKLHLDQDNTTPLSAGDPATNCGGSDPTTPPPTGTSVVHWLEAECAAVGSRWSTLDDANASKGSYVVARNDNSMTTPPEDQAANYVRFTIPNAGAGAYTLFARTGAIDAGSDSYWIRVNGGTWVKWSSGMQKGTGFYWNKYPGGTLELREGANTLDFAYRESNTRLDKVHLNLTGALPLGTGETATNCGGNAPNLPPTAVAAASPTDGVAPLTVKLNGSASSDPDGTIVSYAWKWNGGSATGATPTATFGIGTFDVTLTVTDDKGATASAVVRVTATEPRTSDGAVVAWLEAECAAVGSNWTTTASAAASGGKHVAWKGSTSTSVPPADVAGNRIRFTVSNMKAGSYYLMARVLAPDKLSDSYWVRVNGGAWFAWSSHIEAGPDYNWNRYTGGTLSLTSGTNTIDFAYREAGAALDKLHLNTTGSLPLGTGETATNCGGTTPPPPTTAATSLEAECATVGSGWVVRNASGASNGKFTVFTGDRQNTVPTTDDPAQQVTFATSVASSGTYYLHLRMNAPDAGRNSLWVRVDGGAWTRMWQEIGGAQILTTGFEWRVLNTDGTLQPLQLSAGSHTITVANREPGTELDKIVVSTTAEAPTGTGPSATNCSGSTSTSMGTTAWARPAEAPTEPTVALYPNPTQGNLTLDLESDHDGEVMLRVFDPTGRPVRSLRFDKEGPSLRVQLEVSDLPAGTYRVEVIEGDHHLVRPFVKLR